MQGKHKASRYLDIRLRHEENKNDMQLQQIEKASKIEKQRRVFIIYLLWIGIFVSLIILAALFYAYYLRTRSNKMLRSIESARSDFFTNITHELRTPLTVIQGLNRQMQIKERVTKKEETAFRNAIDRQSSNLLNLVNQLLDLAKLKKGADDPHWKRGDIIAYLQMTAEAFQLYASEKGINLKFYSVIDSIDMDFIPSYIDKIINNLLSNSIKHTDKGGKIEFVVNEGQRPNSITITIEDTGEGIAEKDLAHVFDLFYQSSQAKNIAGTGIGLAFTEVMIEKMKGKIEIDSILGEGTTVTINLPLRNKHIHYIQPLKEKEKPTKLLFKKHLTKTENEQQTETSDKENNLAKPLVLIVEDNSDITLYLKSLLEDKYKVITAWNGQEGLNAAEQHIPDIVITDVMMPIKDGYELAYEMKKNRLINHIPVIMLTAKTTDEDRIKGLRYGIEAYIRKPFQHEELLIPIENIFENRRLLKERYMNAITRTDSKNKLSNDANMKFLEAISDIIHKELTNPGLNSSFLANKMAMSVSQLSRKINGITGYTTISYVLQLKLSKAKKMLADDSILITEVADACGFYDASYFSRVFKKEVGLTPSEYQKKARLSINIMKE